MIEYGIVREWIGTFGFITCDQPPPGSRNGGVFVHQTALIMDGFRELRPGQKVSFELAQDERGKSRAINVRVLDDEAQDLEQDADAIDGTQRR